MATQNHNSSPLLSKSVWAVALMTGCGVVMATSFNAREGQLALAPSVATPVALALTQHDAPALAPTDRASEAIAWRLNNPAPILIEASRANPIAVADKFASRVRSIDGRAALRAYEGAPPVISHPVTDLNVQTCLSCHAQGLRAGDKVAKMMPHTSMTNCMQCHVEAAGALLGSMESPANSFIGFRSSGYGGTRAWTGAPPVMPHSTFMRTNCVSCHGEHGYDGWRPDHLSRTNCIQCHAPAAEFDQLSPSFAVPDLADGQVVAPQP